MGYRFLADLTVLLHAGFLLFVVAGAVLVMRWPRLLPVHLACAIWGTYVELGGKICPLTPLENRLRRLAGEGGYQGGFIEHYVIPVLYPIGLTHRIQVVLGLGVVVVNAALYGFIWRRVRAGLRAKD